jgi:ribosomal protein S18 acetylase RimI-like enzyme
MHSHERIARPDAMVILPATPEDIGSVVLVHCAAFPEFFLTQLGPAFLARYYREVLAFDAGWLFVAKHGGRTIGFVAGFAEPARFYACLRRRPWRWAMPLARGLVGRPWLISRIVARIVTVAERARHPLTPAPGAATCELSSLAVHPLARQQGVGGRLVATLVTAARAADVPRIRLTTDATGNDAVNAFYARLGFRLVRQIAADGRRQMNEYEYNSTPSEAA